MSGDNPAATRQPLYQGHQPDGFHQSVLCRFLVEHRPSNVPRKTGMPKEYSETGTNGIFAMGA
jgi:hypothetical protein